MSIGGRSRVFQPLAPPPRLGRPSTLPRAGKTYLETYTKADGLLAGQADLTWLEAGGQEFTIVSNQATVTAGIAIARAEHDTDTTDMYVQCDWTAGTGASNEILLVGRAGESGGLTAGDYGVSLFVFTDGVDTFVSIEGWNPTGAIADTTLTGQQQLATWRLELSGATATAFRDGTQLCTGTISLSPYPAGTRAGIEVDVAGTIVDNFGFGDL